MKLWELKEKVDALAETHGDAISIGCNIEFEDTRSGGVSTIINGVCYD